MDPFKGETAKAVFELMASHLGVMLTDSGIVDIDKVEVVRVTALVTQVKVWPTGNYPRYYNVQVKELM